MAVTKQPGEPVEPASRADISQTAGLGSPTRPETDWRRTLRIQRIEVRETFARVRRTGRGGVSPALRTTGTCVARKADARQFGSRDAQGEQGDAGESAGR